MIAAPPPREREPLPPRRLPADARTFTVLGKSLDPAQAVPERPHFELGDLDFL